MHCHNDFGMAVANSVAALGSGAEEVHATINGLGERAGNASLEEIVVTLKSLYNLDVNIKTELTLQHIPAGFKINWQFMCNRTRQSSAKTLSLMNQEYTLKVCLLTH